MARPEHLYVFCYDIAKDGIRARVAKRLEALLVRVQDSSLTPQQYPLRF